MYSEPIVLCACKYSYSVHASSTFSFGFFSCLAALGLPPLPPAGCQSCPVAVLYSNYPKEINQYNNNLFSTPLAWFTNTSLDANKKGMPIII